jgi:hypothetical protein
MLQARIASNTNTIDNHNIIIHDIKYEVSDKDKIMNSKNQ